MTTATQIRRWGETGIPIVSLLSAIALFLVGGYFLFILFTLQTNHTLDGSLPNDPVVLSANIETARVGGIAYVGFGMLLLLIAILVARRNRIGFVLAVIAYIIGLIWSGNNFVTYGGDLVTDLSIIVELAMIVASLSILFTNRGITSPKQIVRR